MVSFRPARVEDFDYCASLYFAGMEDIIRQMQLDRSTQVASFLRQWELTEVQIITIEGADVGWVQTRVENETLFLAQLFVEASIQGRGIGTEVMERLIGEANRARRAVTLGVVKINPAMRLYQRLGFRVTHEDERKFYMRREVDGVT